MPGSPYTDLDRPPLDGRALQRVLTGPEALWTRIDLRVETGSTNADAADAARAGEPEGLVVVAERQTAGRGRLGREWVSPARAGIATSVLLRPGTARPERDWPAVPPNSLGWLPLLAGVATAEAVERVAELPAPPGLKWPNDLLLDDRKVAGILAEGVNGAVVIGIGVNVTLRADELPPGVPATSLQLAKADVTDRLPLLRALLRGVEDWYARWRASGGDATACGLRAAYTARSATIGREVRAVLPGGGEVTGTATEIDEAGRLVLRTADGPRAIAAGDILHLR